MEKLFCPKCQILVDYWLIPCQRDYISKCRICGHILPTPHHFRATKDKGVAVNTPILKGGENVSPELPG